MVFKNATPSKPKLQIGIDGHMASQAWVDAIAAAGTKTVTFGNTLWSRWEAVQGTYDQAYIQGIKDVVGRYTAAGIETVCILHGTPAWASNYASQVVATESFPAFHNFFESVRNELPAVKRFQLYQEVDSIGGMPDYFGQWGVPHVEQYAGLLDYIADLTSDVTLHMGLMMLANSWLMELNMYGGFEHIKVNNIHHYPKWYPDRGYDKAYHLNETKAKFDRAILYGDVWLTETCLLSETTATPEYEEAKVDWTESVADYVSTLDIQVLMYYSYKSGWLNADMAAPRPAWTAYKNMCAKYNA